MLYLWLWNIHPKFKFALGISNLIYYIWHFYFYNLKPIITFHICFMPLGLSDMPVTFTYHICFIVGLAYLTFVLHLFQKYLQTRYLDKDKKWLQFFVWLRGQRHKMRSMKWYVLCKQQCTLNIILVTLCIRYCIPNSHGTLYLNLECMYRKVCVCYSLWRLSQIQKKERKRVVIVLLRHLCIVHVCQTSN